MKTIAKLGWALSNTFFFNPTDYLKKKIDNCNLIVKRRVIEIDVISYIHLNFNFNVVSEIHAWKKHKYYDLIIHKI